MNALCSFDPLFVRRFHLAKNNPFKTLFVRRNITFPTRATTFLKLTGLLRNHLPDSYLNIHTNIFFHSGQTLTMITATSSIFHDNRNSYVLYCRTPSSIIAFRAVCSRQFSGFITAYLGVGMFCFEKKEAVPLSKLWLFSSSSRSTFLFAASSMLFPAYVMCVKVLRALITDKPASSTSVYDSGLW